MVENLKQKHDKEKDRTKELSSNVIGLLNREALKASSLDAGSVVLGAATKVEKRISDAETRAEEDKQRAEIAERESREDAMTGAFNRRGLNHEIDLLIGSPELNQDLPVKVRAYDADHFKKINNEFGHDVGDKVLKVIVFLVRVAHPNAIVARTGGDEFVAVTVGEDQGSVGEEDRSEEANMKQALYDNILSPFMDRDKGLDSISVEGLDFELDRELIGVLGGRFNCSIGESEGTLADLEDNGVYSLIKAADEQMYDSKHKKANTKNLYRDR